MKYLIITNEVGISENANSNIVWAICSEMIKENEVHIFSVASFVKHKEIVYKGYPVFMFGPNVGIHSYSSKYNQFKDFIKLIPILLKPNLWVAALRLFIRKLNAEKSDSIESFFAAFKIRLLNKQHNYDRIIAVSAPSMCIHITARLRRFHVSIYQLDPFHSNTTMQLRLKNWRLNIEMLAYKNAECIYLTKLIESDYRNTVLAKYETKWVVVNFPLIYQHVITGESISSIYFSIYKINCLYSGTLDMRYRNPQFALEMAKRLGDDYCFYFIGSNCVEVIENTLGCRDGRIICLNPLPSDAIYQLMASADFLVNIGNTMKNQMPSKIIDYISTGKPIINIVKSSECPTLQYTNRYSLCLDVLETKKIDDNVLADINTFCTSNKSRTIPYQYVEETFFDCTPAHVANIIMGTTA